MNDNNFEQQFIKNVGQSTVANTQTPKNTGTLSLTIAIIMAVIVLIESIALVVISMSYSQMLDNYFSDEGDGFIEETYVNESETAYQFDDSLNLVSFNLTCTAEDGSKFVFKKAKTYQNTSNSSTSSGTYSILNGSVIVLNDSSNSGDQQTLYYEGRNIINGTTYYNCVEDIEETVKE